MPKYNFNLRDADAEQSTPVNFVIRWSNRRLVYPTGEAILPVHWCGMIGQRNYQRAKETRAFPEYPEFNERLDSILGTAKTIFRQFLLDNAREPEVSELRTALDIATGRLVDRRKSDLIAYITDFIARTKDNVNPSTGKRLHPTVHGRNRLALEYLEAYVLKSRKSKTVPFSTVDAEFINGYMAFLVDEDLAVNTVGKYLRAVRMFLNTAVEDGIEVNKGFRSRRISIPEERTEQIFLNENELTDFFHLDLTGNRKLDKVRDRFLVGAWTGLRFGDLDSLDANHIESSRIRIRTGKTERGVVIPLHPMVKAILSKYGGEMPPPMSNQKMNDYLKEVAQMVPCMASKVVTGITKGGVRQEQVKEKWELVSTHTARRSFASNLYLRGIPARTIMAITGHRTESAFLRYIRLDGEQHADMIAASDLFTAPLLRAV